MDARRVSGARFPFAANFPPATFSPPWAFTAERPEVRARTPNALLGKSTLGLAVRASNLRGLRWRDCGQAGARRRLLNRRRTARHRFHDSQRRERRGREALVWNRARQAAEHRAGAAC